MKRNIYKYLVTITLFTLLLTDSVSAAIGIDTLWQKAVSIAEQNARWVPGLIEMRNEELGKNDKVKHLEEVR